MIDRISDTIRKITTPQLEIKPCSLAFWATVITTRPPRTLIAVTSHSISFQVIDGLCNVDTLWPSDVVKTAFGLGLLFIQFFIPVLVLIVCYGQIIWVLTTRINTDLMKNKSVTFNSDNVSGLTVSVTTALAVDPGKEKFQLARRNTIKTLLIVGLCFIICWSQNQILFFMYNCGYDIQFNGVHFDFTLLMVFINCTVNPFIYLIEYKYYQEALKKFFHCDKE